MNAKNPSIILEWRIKYADEQFGHITYQEDVDLVRARVYLNSTALCAGELEELADACLAAADKIRGGE